MVYHQYPNLINFFVSQHSSSINFVFQSTLFFNQLNLLLKCHYQLTFFIIWLSTSINLIHLQLKISQFFRLFILFLMFLTFHSDLEKSWWQLSRPHVCSGCRPRQSTSSSFHLTSELSMLVPAAFSGSTFFVWSKGGNQRIMK